MENLRSEKTKTSAFSSHRALHRRSSDSKGDSVMPSPLFRTQVFKSLNLHLESLSCLFKFPCFSSFYSGTLRSIVVPLRHAPYLLLHLPSSSHCIPRSLRLIPRTSTPHAWLFLPTEWWLHVSSHLALAGSSCFQIAFT